MSKRPYTGFDVIAGGKRAGMETLIKLLEAHFGLWNNGSFGVRKKRGKSSYSVHATGRGADLSWRGAPYRGPGNYEAAVRMMDFLVANADALHIEAVFDYYPGPHGRGYKCDRDAWQVYSKPAFSGAPGGDWVHVEISNAKADDGQFYIDTMKALLGDPPVAVAPAAASAPPAAPPKAPPGKKPWLTRGMKGEEVKAMQAIVGAEPQDGDFGPKTEEAVKAWQSKHDQHVDGIWGPGSQKHSEESCTHETAAPMDSADPDKAADEDAPKYPGQALKEGATGDLVKLVQKKVGATPDGNWGPKTTYAVKLWQKANGRLDDGIVGPKTWESMFGG